MKYNQQKLEHLRHIASAFHSQLTDVNEERRELIDAIQQLKAQRQRDERTIFRSDERRGGQEYRDSHFAKVDKEIEEAQKELARLTTRYHDLSGKYAQARGLLTRCNEFIGSRPGTTAAPFTPPKVEGVDHG